LNHENRSKEPFSSHSSTPPVSRNEQDLQSWAIMWTDLVPSVLARLDETCKSLALEVEQAGGGKMTVGRANISQDGRLSLEYLQVSDCPVAELLGRFIG
jgi:hypothetical protein